MLVLVVEGGPRYLGLQVAENRSDSQTFQLPSIRLRLPPYKDHKSLIEGSLRACLYTEKQQARY